MNLREIQSKLCLAVQVVKSLSAYFCHTLTLRRISGVISAKYAEIVEYYGIYN